MHVRLVRWLAIAALAGLLIRSIAIVWFTSEVVALSANTEVASPPLTDRVVLIVVDGLRYDTALESELMPKLQALARAGAEGPSLASLVTMTGLGVRTLGTATSPALADILLEARLPAVTFDTVFAAIRARGGHIGWLGNTAWRELFGEWIDIDAKIDAELELMARANNVWAADRVIVRRAVRAMTRTDWQLFVVHVGGLDNASHRFTPFGEQFRAKARSVDDDVAQIVGAALAAGPRTTVIVTSDHGASDRGHHGSGELITRRTPLVLAGAAIAPGRTLEAHQTDVAPTIAALLGLPLPAPSEGVVQVDALAISADTAAALRAENARQHQRYARAYAAERGTEPPAIDDSPDGLRRLGEWIEDSRARSSIGPALWALALAAVALTLFAPLPRPRITRAAVIAIAALIALEIAIAIWKLNHRFVEMKMHDVYNALSVSDTSFQMLVAILAAAAVAWLSRRAWPTSRWAIATVVFAAAALADQLAIPAAIAAGIAAAIATTRGPHRTAAAALALVGCAAIAVIDRWRLESSWVAVVAPLALATAAGALDAYRLRARLAVVACGVAAAAVRLADNPALPYRAVLAAIAIAALVLAHSERAGRPIALVGWLGAIALTMLSQPHQQLGLVAWVGFAACAGRTLDRTALPRDGGGDRAALVATAIALGFRYACFGLFEGAFEISRLEVWLAYQGNPGTEVAFGAAIIAIKLALPLAVGLAFATAALAPAARRTAIAWTVAFLMIRIAHITIGMTVARGTFYSPYLDSGQLVFTYLVALSVPVIVAVFAAAGALTTATSPRMR